MPSYKLSRIFRPHSVTVAERAEYAEELRWLTDNRPRVRADCVDGIRPCPWVSCKYHLFLTIAPNGNIRYSWPGVELYNVTQPTCALDVADEGPHTLEQISEIDNTQKECIRQLEEVIFARLRAKFPEWLREYAEAREEEDVVPWITHNAPPFTRPVREDPVAVGIDRQRTIGLLKHIRYEKAEPASVVPVVQPPEPTVPVQPPEPVWPACAYINCFEPAEVAKGVGQLGTRVIGAPLDFCTAHRKSGRAWRRHNKAAWDAGERPTSRGPYKQPHPGPPPLDLFGSPEPAPPPTPPSQKQPTDDPTEAILLLLARTDLDKIDYDRLPAGFAVRVAKAIGAFRL